MGDSVRSPLIGRKAQTYILWFAWLFSCSPLVPEFPRLWWYVGSVHCADYQNETMNRTKHIQRGTVYEIHKILRTSVMHCYNIIFIIQCQKIATQGCTPLFSGRNTIQLITLHSCPSCIIFSIFDSWALRWCLRIKIQYHLPTRPAITVVRLSDKCNHNVYIS